jgi:crotonobetaine/carnitine-CoA ligase
MNLPDLHCYTGRNVPWLFQNLASASADEPFLIWEPFSGEALSWTYEQFSSSADRLAAGLSASGIVKGDFILIHLENSPEFLLSWFACSRIGAVSVATNVHSAEGELEYFASHSGATAAITQPSLFSTLHRGASDLQWISCTDNNAGEPAEQMPAENQYVPFAQLANDRSPVPEVQIDASDTHSIMYTSGTTSRPKGVVYTHANFLWAAHRNSAHCELTSEDIAYCFLPLFHANALTWQMLATFWVGGTIVLQPRFSASRFWEVSGRHGCTWSVAAPFVTQGLKQHPDPVDHNFRFWANIATPDDEVFDAWGIPSTGWYGMTETISQPIMSDIRFPSENHVIGRPMPEYEVAVLDEEGAPLKSSGLGLLKLKGIRGLSLFAEYLNDPEATAAAFDQDGWFDTGDMVMLFEDGCLAFADRDKDMLKVGGENVAASEVETVIASLEGVIECAVVGRPHKFLHETPYAFVVAEKEHDDLVDAINAICEKQLATFKRPRDIVFIDELPRTRVGKMNKVALRERIGIIRPIDTKKSHKQ